MSKVLNDLSSRFFPKAVMLLARCVEAQIPVMIIGTGRTEEEQEANLRNGVSWTKNSKHLTGDAIDICPYEIYSLQSGKNKLYWEYGEVWEKIGAIGESIGLRWGGRWTKKDYGHFEIGSSEQVVDKAQG